MHLKTTLASKAWRTLKKRCRKIARVRGSGSYRIVSLVMLENISIKSLKYDFLNMSSRRTIEIDMAKRTRESP